MYISKLSECKQVEFSTSVLADFSNFKYFCNTWIFSASFYDFVLYSLKLCCSSLSCSTSMSCSSPILVTLPFLFSRIRHNLSIASIVYVVPLSLVAFNAASCSSLSFFIFKQADLLIIDSLECFCPFVLEKLSNWYLSYF